MGFEKFYWPDALPANQQNTTSRALKEILNKRYYRSVCLQLT